MNFTTATCLHCNQTILQFEKDNGKQWFHLDAYSNTSGIINPSTVNLSIPCTALYAEPAMNSDGFSAK